MFKNILAIYGSMFQSYNFSKAKGRISLLLRTHVYTPHLFVGNWVNESVIRYLYAAPSYWCLPHAPQTSTPITTDHRALAVCHTASAKGAVPKKGCA